MFSVVFAATETFGIGMNHNLPWRLKGDMAFFRTLTTSTTDNQKSIIMGRKTWDSLPERFRPLPNRQNIVLTRDTAFQTDDALVTHSFEEALQKCTGSIFVIGGADVYAQALTHPHCEYVYWTQVRSIDGTAIPCDTFIKVSSLPEMGFQLDTTIQSETTENEYIYEIRRYRKE